MGGPRSPIAERAYGDRRALPARAGVLPAAPAVTALRARHQRIFDARRLIWLAWCAAP
jgi:hypothetical protein